MPQSRGRLSLPLRPKSRPSSVLPSDRRHVAPLRPSAFAYAMRRRPIQSRHSRDEIPTWHDYSRFPAPPAGLTRTEDRWPHAWQGAPKTRSTPDKLRLTPHVKALQFRLHLMDVYAQSAGLVPDGWRWSPESGDRGQRLSVPSPSGLTGQCATRGHLHSGARNTRSILRKVSCASEGLSGRFRCMTSAMTRSSKTPLSATPSGTARPAC